MAVTILGLAAGTWGIFMAISPLLQIRQMWRRKSSEDVSLGYFGVLLPGFALWIAYGTVRADWALVVPNTVALLVGGTTVLVAQYYRALRRGKVRPRRMRDVDV
ncbi:MAG TPA: SemiSWEET family transporter [Micromonosporaceae bacterium]|nr:SemiSWEET family transporter [Micromonosporaceae bacterium]